MFSNKATRDIYYKMHSKQMNKGVCNIGKDMKIEMKDSNMKIINYL